MPRLRLIALPILVFLFTVPALAAPPASCPDSNELGNFQVASNVAAVFSNSGSATTYYFASLTNENPVGGQPGLAGYCIYPSPATQPTAIVAQADGANGDAWTFLAGSSDFMFGRAAGNHSDIPLDGKTTLIGTATWSGDAPTVQTILLDINDATVCAKIYGGSLGNCFVKPSQGPACDISEGETKAAYNAIPFGAAYCATYSLNFEATATNEFGDEVQLAGTSRKLVSLKVLFASWACESGHWYDGTCSTTPGTTFQQPITANIYAVSDCSGTPCPGTLLATVTPTLAIPYRPSADPVNCPGPDAYGEIGDWFNAVAGQCKSQISTVLTFSFPRGITIPDQVIWTVAFDTTHSGYTPIGESTLCFTSGPGGCAYDSLNVGAETFPGAPYAGIDVDPDVAFMSFWQGGYPPPFGSATLESLQSQTGLTSYKPLGEITTK